MKKLLLGVNIDHIATLRNARNSFYPDPVQAAFIAEQSGADLITVHLREDRRHISDRDVYILKKTIQSKMNLEISTNYDMIKIACKVKPDICCLVPEKREEITTEGGLNIIKKPNKISDIIKLLNDNNILVSIFIDPEESQIDAALNIKAKYIEINTGMYSTVLKNKKKYEKELFKIKSAATYGYVNGLKIHAGHGLNYHNVLPIAGLAEICELNIGHAIIAYSTIYGLSYAVKKMKNLIEKVRK